MDRKLARNWSHQLSQTQKKTWRQYEEVLAQEEIIWYKKSRAKWLEFGDRNTKCTFMELLPLEGGGITLPLFKMRLVTGLTPLEILKG